MNSLSTRPAICGCYITLLKHQLTLVRWEVSRACFPLSFHSADSDLVGAHTDFGGITFLLQQPGSKGLQVWYPPTESWVPVPVTPDSYVVNIGDLTEKWTAGYYRSALHRVINFGEKHRYSAPFFLNGNMKMQCEALDGSGLRFGVREHFMMRLKRSLGEEKSKFLEKSKTATVVTEIAVEA